MTGSARLARPDRMGSEASVLTAELPARREYRRTVSVTTSHRICARLRQPRAGTSRSSNAPDHIAVQDFFHAQFRPKIGPRGFLAASYSRIHVVLSSVYFSMACNDLSRPLPLCL